MRESSKRFDRLHAGDQVTVLGVQHTVVEVHGPYGGADSNLWHISISRDMAMNRDSQIILPRNAWITCKTESKPPYQPVPRHVHESRSPARRRMLEGPHKPYYIYVDGEYN